MDRVSQLDSLFAPRSLAVIGASPGGNFGGRFFQSLIDFGFKGRLFPVNRRGEDIAGWKGCASVLDIPEEVEAADIMVPARFVPEVLEQCLAKGVRGAQIFSSGFAETGTEEGIALERRLREIAAKGIRVIGPNCFGVYCPRGGHTLLPGGDFPKDSGPVAFISQSGGHAVEIGREAVGRGLRYSIAVSYGNGCDVNESDLLEYAAQDSETKVITMYLEGPREGRRFLRLVREIAPKKPVIIWKAGLTPQGSRAVRSHTGSLAGDEAIWEAVFRQTAAVRVSNLEELEDTAQALLTLPRGTGGGIGMIGGGGGISVAAADACSRFGMEIPPFDEGIRGELDKALTAAGTANRNPVDLGAPIIAPPIYQRVMEIVAGAACVETVISTQSLFYVFRAVGPLVAGEDVIRVLMDIPVQVMERFGKPVVMVLPVGGEEADAAEVERRRRQARDFYREKGILVMPTLERATRAVANVVKYYRRLAERS